MTNIFQNKLPYSKLLIQLSFNIESSLFDVLLFLIHSHDFCQCHNKVDIVANLLTSFLLEFK